MILRAKIAALVSLAGLAAPGLAYQPEWWSPEPPSWVPVEELQPGQVFPLPDTTPVLPVEGVHPFSPSFEGCVSRQLITTLTPGQLTSRVTVRSKCSVRDVIHSFPGSVGWFCPVPPNLIAATSSSQMVVTKRISKGVATVTRSNTQGAQLTASLEHELKSEAEFNIADLLGKVGVSSDLTFCVSGTYSTSSSHAVTVSGEDVTESTNSILVQAPAEQCWTHYGFIESVDKYAVKHVARPDRIEVYLCYDSQGGSRLVAATRGGGQTVLAKVSVKGASQSPSRSIYPCSVEHQGPCPDLLHAPRSEPACTPQPGAKPCDSQGQPCCGGCY